MPSSGVLNESGVEVLVLVTSRAPWIWSPSATSTPLPMASWLPAISTALYRLIGRSEEHTSELQSHVNLVCRLLLEKKKKKEIKKQRESDEKTKPKNRRE